MRKPLYFVLLLVGLSACGCKQQPFQVLPMTANNPSIPDRGEPPVPGFFYVKNFSDNKECLKKLLHYITDTIRKELPFRSWGSFLAEIHKKNKGIEFEGGEPYSDEQEIFYCSFNRRNTHFITTFRTWSKLWISTADFPQKCDYPYHIVRKGKSAVVYFDYKEFNTDVWQKFLNVVFYNREKIWWEDYKRYDLWRDNVVLAWRNWSAPTRYSLLNQHTREIECVIEYPLEDDYTAFTMEIR